MSAETTLADALASMDRVCAAATPGPWKWTDEGDYTNELVSWGVIEEETGECGTVLSRWPKPVIPEGRDCDEADAAHIAACSPEVVRALLGVVLPVVVNHGPYTTVGVTPGAVVCLDCSDLEEGLIVPIDECPYQPALDHLRDVMGVER